MPDLIQQLATAVAQVNAKLVAHMNREPKLQAWIAPTLINSWANSGGAYAVAGYWKDPYGIVHLRGRITGGAFPSDAFVLLSEYVPQGISTYYTPTGGIVWVTLSGAVNVRSGSSPVSLDGISFRAYNHVYVREVLSDGPAGYWKFGEQSGTVTVDSSGNGYIGAYGSACVLAQAGALAGDVDTAVDFPADPANGKMDVPDTAALRITGDITLEAWVYLDSYVSNGHIIGKTSAASSLAAPYRWRVVATSGIPDFIMGNGVTETIFVATAAVGLAGWHHLAVTRSGATVTHYRDGVPNGTTSAFAPAAIADAGSFMRVGSNGLGSGGQVDGRIDEVAIYNTALSADRILAHYNAGV